MKRIRNNKSVMNQIIDINALQDKRSVNSNDKCPCGCGRKYKNCCSIHHKVINTEDMNKKIQITNASLIKEKNNLSKKKMCIVPDSMRINCDKHIINAHSVPIGLSLKHICNEDENVLAFVNKHNDIGNLLKKSETSFNLSLVSIRHASTFKGFCKHHDTILFSDIENKQCVLNNKQCFLLHYLAFAKVYYNTKSASESTDRRIKRINTYPIITRRDYLLLQDFKKDEKKHVTKVANTLQRLNSYKESLFTIIESDNYEECIFFTIFFNKNLAYMANSFLNIMTDFCGNEINMEEKENHVSFSIISQNNKSILLIASLIKYKVVFTKLIESLFKYNVDCIPNTVTKYIYNFSSNIYINPDWWESTDQLIKEYLLAPYRSLANGAKKIGILKDLEPDYKFGDWEIVDAKTNVPELEDVRDYLRSGKKNSN